MLLRFLGPTSNVGVSNVGVFKRRSHQTEESSNAGVSNVGRSNARVVQTSESSLLK